MMKNKYIYVCENCGVDFSKWQGKCSNCGEWNTLVETKIFSGKTSKPLIQIEAQKISSINSTCQNRIKTKIEEFDRVLGGGLVPGSTVLLAGEPGIGKSTMVLQAVEKIKKVLYISGEESSEQVKLRIVRLKIENKDIYVLADGCFENIIQVIEKIQPEVIIIDSIQAMYSNEISSTPGSISQVKSASINLQSIAKLKNIPMILTSHVTKEGVVAGPMALEHLVDAVLYLEGDRYGQYRILRAMKNRFGRVSEAGIFEMKENGLKEVKNPSSLFWDENSLNVPGAVISCILEGNRPILVEVQALADKTFFGYPKRTTQGIDLNKLFMILAVLGKRANLNLTNYDIYINIVGGFKVKEPAIDLALAIAIASILKNQSVWFKMLITGEVGLSGEIRPVSQLESRISEASKLGFKKAIIPNVKLNNFKNMELIKVKNLSEAIKFALIKEE